MARYFKFTADTPYCGTENHFYQKFDHDPTEEELEEYATQYAEDNADSFEYLVHGWDAEPEEGEEEEWEQEIEWYREDCSCNYEEISEAEYQEAIG